jgi:predicted nucleotidyltransferase component of viral defense system
VIPRDFITEWRPHAPWVENLQVEQDLVISRALVELFTHPLIARSLAFRGGTALYKLHLHPPARYSEDIDLVQIAAAPIGPVLSAVRAVLDPWLGNAQWKQTAGRATLIYRFNSEDEPPYRLKLKVEINTREHFSVYGLRAASFTVTSRWFTGTASIATYQLDELLGTKLRALYQRKKGRDLFDLALPLKQGSVAPERIVEAFLRYMESEGEQVTRAVFEQNLAGKRADPVFAGDITPLLAHGHSWDMDSGIRTVLEALIARLPGEPWKGVG